MYQNIPEKSEQQIVNLRLLLILNFYSSVIHVMSVSCIGDTHAQYLNCLKQPL
jgi:hypothetical protein